MAVMFSQGRKAMSQPRLQAHLDDTQLFNHFLCLTEKSHFRK